MRWSRSRDRKASRSGSAQPSRIVAPRRQRAFTLQTSSGDACVDRVIVATGGLSVPATGSDGTGLDIARRLNHRMVDTYPALTPILGSDEAHAALSGVSFDVRLRAKGSAPKASDRNRTFGGFLFTHRGYSGPSVLDISHLTARGEKSDHPRAVVASLRRRRSGPRIARRRPRRSRRSSRAISPRASAST